MTMRNRICQHYPNTYITTHNVSSIYIADFTERSQSIRKVEVHTSVPPCPKNPTKLMDCFEIINSFNNSLEFNVFDDNQFQNEEDKSIVHCEGCFYPAINNDKCWIVMLEIKDCKVKNIVNYKKNIKDKIINTVKIFRDSGIIINHQVFGIASFPRRNKTSFNDYIFGDNIATTALYKEHGIFFHATNKIEITEIGKIKFL